MSSDRDVNRIVRSWLREDRHEDANRVLGAVLDHVDATPQRRSTPWSAWRTPNMNKFVAVGLGAAALVVAIFIGAQLVGPPNVVAPPTDTPSPSASEPSATPEAVVDFTGLVGEGTPLVPGQYLITTALPVQVTITVRDEPIGGQPSEWFKAIFNWGPWHQSNLARLGVVDVVNLYADPCNRPLADLRDPAVGPSVADLAAALATIPQVSASAPVDAMLDGYSGLLVELTAGDRTEPCPEESFLWTTTDPEVSLSAPDPGALTRVWILDVDGNRLVIFAAEDADFTDPESVQALVDSIQIDLE